MNNDPNDRSSAGKNHQGPQSSRDKSDDLETIAFHEQEQTPAIQPSSSIRAGTLDGDQSSDLGTIEVSCHWMESQSRESNPEPIDPHATEVPYLSTLTKFHEADHHHTIDYNQVSGSEGETFVRAAGQGDANRPREYNPNDTTQLDTHHAIDPFATEGVLPATDLATNPIPVSSPSLSPERVGGSKRFELVRPHAGGGLGIVSVARDRELNREVALKEIRPRHADDFNSRARFLLEAEVTGGLEHPGIVPVYSLGSYEDGRPYYAMRFIRGETLRSAIERFHKSDDNQASYHVGERRLELIQLLKRFIDCCDALGYAHSRRVIHRDIKPDNIMLGPYGETLVVDWGLAKAIDAPESPTRLPENPLRPISGGSTTPTVAGSAMGTPAFMSPEQAEGDLDRIGPSSDIYSLGATLYNLLTGELPFQESTLHMMLVKVGSGEFPPPRSIRPEVPAALEAICLKAMALKPEERYLSCQEFAGDLARWIADEPISCFQEPLLSRLRRWGKRHRTLVTGVAVSLSVGVVGLTLATVLLERERSQTAFERDRATENEQLALDEKERADQERDRALQAKERADREEVIAQKNFQMANDAVDTLLSEVATIDLVDDPRMERIRRNLLTKALNYYLVFLQQEETPKIRRETGRAHQRVGDIQELLGNDEIAEAAYRDAIAIQESLVNEAPDDLFSRADLAKTQEQLGILLKKRNRFDDAKALLEAAVDSRENALADDPEEPSRQRDLASATYQLGALLARTVGNDQPAEARYETAIDLQRQVLRAFREPLTLQEAQRELARFLNNNGLLLQRQGRTEEAAESFDEAIRLQRQLVQEEPDVARYRRELARTINNRHRQYLERAAIEGTHVFQEAIVAYQEAAEIADQLTRDYPLVPEYWQEQAGYLNNYATVLLFQGRLEHNTEDRVEAINSAFEDAERLYRRALEIRERLVQNSLRPEYKHRLALLKENIAGFLVANLQRSNSADPDQLLKEGRELLESAIEILGELTESYPRVSEYPHDQARVFGMLASLEVQERVESAATTIRDLSSDDIQAVLEVADRAVRLAEEAYGLSPNRPDFRETLAQAYWRSGMLLEQEGKATELFERAEEIGAIADQNPMHWFRAAQGAVRAAELVPNDLMIDESDRSARIDRYKATALRFLSTAAEVGWSRKDQVIEYFDTRFDDDELAPILERVDQNTVTN